MDPDIITSTSSATSFEAARIDAGAPVISDVVEDFLDNNFGVGVSNVVYNGTGFSGFFVNQFAIPGVFSLSGGILLTTGAFPGDTNTQSGFSETLGTNGDTDLDAVAQAAFDGSGTTFDASVIEFEVNITDPTVDGFSFDLVFGSEEFPEFSNSNFVDVGAVFVNGQNVALFNDDPSQPLSVIDDNLVNGNFINNSGEMGPFMPDDGEGGEFEEFEGEGPGGPFEIDLGESGNFATELDGFSNVLTIRAGLEQGLNTIKIGVADTGDTILDSILYVTNFNILTDGATGGGVLQVVDGTDDDDMLEASLASEEINLFDGQDMVIGTAEELNGDFITGFGEDDTLFFPGDMFETGDIGVTFGSAILDIDTDGDGEVDTTITLEGDFEGAEFSATQSAEGTTVSFEFPPMVPEINEILGTDGNDRLVGTDGDDRIVSGAGRIDRSEGGAGSDMFVFGEETNNTIRERDIITEFDVELDSIFLEDGASVASIRDTSAGVYIALEGDGDAIIVYGDNVDSDSITIISDTDLF